MEAIDQVLALDIYNNWKGTEGSMAHKFEIQKGLDALEELQKNPNKHIYDQALKILTTYFEIDNEMEVSGGNPGP
jgi:hypothetical protein